MSPEGAFIVSGVSGAGKTTVSRLLASSFRRGAHIEADNIQDLIVSGGLHPQEQPAAEAARQQRLRIKNVSLLADSFADALVVPVIDDTVVTREHLHAYLSDLRTRPLRLVMLAPPADVALMRDRERGYKRVGHIWGHLDGTMRSEMVGLGLWIDTAGLSPAETVHAVLASPDRALLS